MKLYTEEQLNNTVNAIQYYIIRYGIDSAQERIIKHVKALQPVELPSDEDIFNESIKIMEEWYGSGCKEEIDAHFRGAKWLIDKIKNQKQ